MSFICSISGEVPDEPVVSPASGGIFEKRLIVKFINENGQDPVNGQTLTEEDLIAIQAPTVVRPRAPNATSIPAIVKLLQDEWDSVMLETFKMRQHVESVRQELSYALYQHDAACRVIARLTRERDQARQALATLQPSAAAAAAAAAGGDVGAMDVDAGLDKAIVTKIEKTYKTLTKSRKKRAVPKDLTSAEAIQSFKQTNSFTGVHSASHPGITCVAVHPTSDNLVLTGGQDKMAYVFDVSEEKVVSTLKGHTKKVTGALLHPSKEIAVTCSADSTIRIWNTSTAKAKCAHIVRTHSAPVCGIALHPSNEYFISASEDGVWALHDISSGTALYQASDEKVTCIQMHPDGMIFALGTASGVVRIWNVKECSHMISFEGHEGATTALAFSENGFFLASAAADGVVKVWDLRKPGLTKTLAFDESHQIASLAFDQSGSYLAVGGTDVRVFSTNKAWEHLTTLTDHTALVTSVGWSSLATGLVSSSMDRSLAIFQA